MSNLGMISPQTFMAFIKNELHHMEHNDEKKPTKDLEATLNDKNASPLERTAAAHALAARGDTANIPTSDLIKMAKDPRASDETKAHVAEELGKRMDSSHSYEKDDDNDEINPEELHKWEAGARHASTKSLEKAVNDPDASPEKRLAAAHELAARGKTADIPDEFLAQMAQDPRASDHTKANIAEEMGKRGGGGESHHASYSGKNDDI